jgi:hypothetical protein
MWDSHRTAQCQTKFVVVGQFLSYQHCHQQWIRMNVNSFAKIGTFSVLNFCSFNGCEMIAEYNFISTFL